MKTTATLLLTAFAILSFSANMRAAATGDGQPAKAVVELFTSQGCYSCPPADRVLGELATTRADVVALEFHVDYWDRLVYGSAGSWKDPFSDASYSARQRDYNARSLKGRTGVYTPQMVVNGSYALVGSDGATLASRLDEAPPLALAVVVQTTPEGLGARFGDGYAGGFDVWQANFIDYAETPVSGGENNGKFLENHNIVTKLWHIGSSADAARGTVPLRPLYSGRRCAVFAQTPSGEIVGAAYCPR